MKAFFGAMTLTFMAAVIGIFAATELHAMAISAGGTSALIRTTTVDATRHQQRQQIEQETCSDDSVMQRLRYTALEVPLGTQ